jgi:hypothetical protein
MADLSDFLAQELLDHIFNNAAYPSPTTVYISCHTADPGENGANEVVGGSYGRQAGVFGAPYLDSGNSNTPTVSTTAATTFLDMPATSVTHLGFWDDPSAGAFLGRFTCGATLSPSAGEAVSFPAGDIDFTLD